MSTSIALRALLAMLVACSSAAMASSAAAEEATAPVLDEAADAWLHDHCAYRGLGQLVESSSPGRVVETVGTGSSAFHKAFLCATPPPFWKEPWTPASDAAVACTDLRKTGDTCVPPLVPISAAPLVAATVPAASARRDPPEMPEPTPPKRVAKPRGARRRAS
jgi:hypothetical protein